MLAIVAAMEELQWSDVDEINIDPKHNCGILPCQIGGGPKTSSGSAGM